MTKPLVILVDSESLTAAALALEGHDVRFMMEGSDLILSTKARYFEPEWFNDPKLVEAALKRARADKKKKVKK